MQTLMEIGLDTHRLLSMLVGLVGLAFSLLLLFSPAITQRVCNVLNRPISMDKNFHYLNAYVAFDRLAHRHHAMVGSLIAAGGFFLSFFFWKPMDARFLAGLFGPVTTEFAIHLGRVTGIAGIGLGLLLALRPSLLLRIEGVVNRWISTEPLVDALNQMRFPIDSIVMRHPIVFGLCGMASSTALILMSLMQIFDL